MKFVKISLFINVHSFPFSCGVLMQRLILSHKSIPQIYFPVETKHI